MENKTLLQMRGIDKHFGATHALKGIDLTLERGEVLGLIGENGAGKSTIIKILSGAYGMDAGEILIDGVPVNIGNPRASQALGISTIYQELTLFPDLNAVDNILAGREICRDGTGSSLISPLDRQRMRKEARQILTEELGIDIDLTVPVRQLSLAEKQLVEIARSLHSQAQIIIMDEPTEALESQERERLFAITDRMRLSGRAVIYVSHLLDELVKVCDKVMVMRDGANVATQPVSEVSVETIISKMIGRDLGQKYADKTPPSGEVILRANRLGVNGRFDDVSFELQKGEILGFAGLDGAGKQDVVRAIYGVVPFNMGDISVDGKSLTAGSISGAKAAGVGLMPADRKTEGLFLDKSLEWNITIAESTKSRSSSLRLSDLKASAGAYMRSMSIRARSVDQSVGDLSGGNQQKAMLARWLQTKPKVLVLEEPTRGVDIKSKAEIYRQVVDAAAAGTSFIVVSADSPELLGLCHRILVMHSGRVAAELDASTTDAETIAYYSVQTTGEHR
ncbi:sugar ABC transporter ATP-binding protein [Paenarthrobacter sp. NyZ202]|uniref:sugar ABC transporter ATP-binding protein n=1 Tax=Paenarthrobacter sp. NyZ202 TaxID=3402689 RepID=UPI003CE85D7E